MTQTEFKSPFEPRVQVFSIQPTFPLDRAFLEEVLAVAANDPMAVPVWATVAPEKDGQGRVRAYWLTPKESRGQAVPQERFDINTVQRGLYKILELRLDYLFANRLRVIRALYEQHTRPTVFTVYPQLASDLVQLALFDQIVY